MSTRSPRIAVTPVIGTAEKWRDANNKFRTIVLSTGLEAQFELASSVLILATERPPVAASSCGEATLASQPTMAVLGVGNVVQPMVIY